MASVVERVLSGVDDASAAGGDADALAESTVAVTSVTADGGRVESTVEYSPDLRPFFEEEPFYVEYDVDVSAVPEPILAIPVLAQVCPVAWAVGADVSVPTVDRRFLDALQTVGRALYEMYPFVEGGRVVAGRAPEVESAADNSGTGMLFTGGVDSLATYVRHREEAPTLINVLGWVIDVDDEGRWEHTKARIGDYAERFGVDARFVQSNMLEFLDTTMLNATYKPHHDGSWYSAVGSGLGMTGLCAPLAAAEGMGRLYVAASHWDGFPAPDRYDYWDGGAIPWGSDPAIDDEVAWTGTEVVHDAFELTRQDRVEVIADYVAEHDPDLPVRACEDSATGANCNCCEKCVRTAFGLALAGVDPNDHGFDLGAADFEHAREEFEAGNWLTDYHHQVYWQEFQRRVDPDAEFPVDGADELAEWLRDADVEAVAARSKPPVHQRALRAVARSAPYPVYARLYPVYDSVRHFTDRP